MKNIVPVVLCSGSGAGLWPFSRSYPDSDSFLQKTIKKILAVTDPGETQLITITLKSLRAETALQLCEISPLLVRHLLLEPQARDTAAAAAYAIQYAEACFGEDVLLWIVPVHDFTMDEAVLADMLEKAEIAASRGYMATLGDPLSGMHLFQARTGRDNFIELAPQTWNVVRNAMRESVDPRQPSTMVYGAVKEEPFEIAVVQKVAKAVVVPAHEQQSPEFERIQI